KKLSLFMIATAAVVGLSLATPENQTVSAYQKTDNRDSSVCWTCCPLTCLKYEVEDLYNAVTGWF
ncbi:TPA: SpoV family signaling peptide, partial [Streptococcus pyogenes]